MLELKPEPDLKDYQDDILTIINTFAVSKKKKDKYLLVLQGGYAINNYISEYETEDIDIKLYLKNNTTAGAEEALKDLKAHLENTIEPPLTYKINEENYINIKIAIQLSRGGYKALIDITIARGLNKEVMETNHVNDWKYTGIKIAKEQFLLTEVTNVLSNVTRRNEEILIEKSEIEQTLEVKNKSLIDNSGDKTHIMASLKWLHYKWKTIQNEYIRYLHKIPRWKTQKELLTEYLIENKIKIKGGKKKKRVTRRKRKLSKKRRKRIK